MAKASGSYHGCGARPIVPVRYSDQGSMAEAYTASLDGRTWKIIAFNFNCTARSSNAINSAFCCCDTEAGLGRPVLVGHGHEPGAAKFARRRWRRHGNRAITFDGLRRWRRRDHGTGTGAGTAVRIAGPAERGGCASNNAGNKPMNRIKIRIRNMSRQEIRRFGAAVGKVFLKNYGFIKPRMDTAKAGRFKPRKHKNTKEPEQPSRKTGQFVY